MNKLIITIVMLLLLSACLSGCDGRVADINNNYSLEKVNGRYYMVFEDYGVEPTPEGVFINYTGSIEFESVEKLKERLTGKLLNAGECDLIKRTFDKDEHGIGIIDIDNIYTPGLPEGIEVKQVRWQKEKCWLFLCDPSAADGGDKGAVLFCDQQTYEAEKSKDPFEFYTSSELERAEVRILVNYETGERVAFETKHENWMDEIIFEPS